MGGEARRGAERVEGARAQGRRVRCERGGAVRGAVRLYETVRGGTRRREARRGAERRGAVRCGAVRSGAELSLSRGRLGGEGAAQRCRVVSLLTMALLTMALLTMPCLLRDLGGEAPHVTRGTRRAVSHQCRHPWRVRGRTDNGRRPRPGQ